MKQFFTMQIKLDATTIRNNQVVNIQPEKGYIRRIRGLFMLISLIALFAIPGNSYAQAKNDALPYLIENFDGYAFQSMPTGWTGNFQVWPFGGSNSTYRLTRRITNNNEVWSWETPLVAISAGAALEFTYRVVEPSSYPSLATPAENFVITLLIKEPDDAEFQQLMVIDDENHVVSNAYANKNIDLDAWAGKDVVIRAEVLHVAGDFWTDFDIVKAGTFRTADFTLLNTSGNPVQNATISIEGFGDQVTDTNGEASFELPSGQYSYDVTATNYLTFTDGTFEVTTENLDVVTPGLIGNFIVTFSTRDQDDAALSGVTIQWQGTAQGYDGETEISGTLTSGLTGFVVAHLPNGTYSFTAQLDNYYDIDDTFIQTNAAQQLNISMQIFPEVTFTVLEDDGTGSGDPGAPIEGATIRIEGFEDLTTDITGVATGRLPVGNYNFTARKIGFLANGAAFNVTDNNISYNLPPIALAPAPPTFAFSDYESGDEIVFDRVPVGESSLPLVVEFLNAGIGTVTVDPAEILLTGAGADYFTIIKPAGIVNLATGETATITLTFEPENEDIQNAELEIGYSTTGKNGELATLLLKGEPFIPIEIPFFEDFESGNFNNWFVANGAQINQWQIGNAANDAGNLSAIVSNNGGVTNSYQTSGASSVVHFYTDIDIPMAAEGDLTLQFNWKNAGETNIDYIRVYLLPVSTLPTAGSTILAPSIATLFNQTEWQTFTYAIPSSNFGEKRRLVFTWRNDPSGGQQPPGALDNIYVGNFFALTVEVATPGTGTAAGNSNAGAGVSVPVEATPADGYEFLQWSAPSGSFEDATQANTLFTMPAEAVTVTATFIPSAPVAENVTFVYDGTEKTATVTTHPSFDVVWYDAATGGNPTTAPAAADTGTYTAWAASKDSNDLESERVEVTLTITQAPLTIIADDIDKTEGETYTFAGDEFSTDPASLYASDAITQVTLISAGALADAVPGDYPIFISDATGPGADNYAITYQNGILTVNEFVEPIALTITNIMAADKEYDTTTDATVDDWGTLDGIDLAHPDVSLDITNALATFDTPDAGNDITVTITGLALAGADASYYSLTCPVTTTADILTKGLTVTAEDASKVYGDADPILTATYDGFAGSEDETVLTGTLSVTREAGEDVNTYAISASGVSSTNYTITFEPGVFTITPKELTIGGSFEVADKDFDGTTDATITDNQLTLIGVKVVDDIALTNLTAEFASAGPGDDILVTLTMAELSGAGMANYTLSPDNWPTTTASIFVLTYELTISITPVDGGTVTGEGTYEAGTDVLLSATPAVEHIFLRWEDAAGTELSTDASYTYTMPADDVTLTAVFQSQVSVIEPELAGISLYPNPASEQVTIRSGNTIEQIIIMDISGRIVFAETISQTEARIATTTFHQGIYLVRIHTTEGVEVRKLEVNR